MGDLKLLVHPVRLRIVHAMTGGRTMTTTQLAERLPDVSKATVYRHVGLLADAGVLEVAGEQRVHGAVERQYRLRREAAMIDADAAARATPEDHRRAFAAAMTILIAEFNAYLNRDHADPTGDPVGYRQHALWLNQQELTEMIDDLRQAIIGRLANEPTPDRSQYLLSPILFPIDQPPHESDKGQ